MFPDMTEQVDDRDVHGVQGEEMCIGEVTEEDMLHKFVGHEEHGHDEDSGAVVFLERGTGVCLGATGRSGNLENRDREDQER